MSRRRYKNKYNEKEEPVSHSPGAICPTCGKRISLQATVNRFLEHPEWHFWGEEGKRWIVCNTPHSIHFKVAASGVISHRLVFIKEGSR